ncbi:transposase [Halorientalis regularis]|uniref:Transposase DDE domain-containing protein n=1 Tax=Halorientalis regularis TaxID=660518 RepID=A0A1G7PSJ1_9EURY|nr:transposase [Halorientalis regularis]SDF89302.1 Transposase DDE domain-containing protein [Halorientalis regularis]
MSSDVPAVAEALVTHAEAVCDYADHLWRVVGNLSVPTDLLTDTRDTAKVTYSTEQMVRCFLYAEIREFSHNELADQLHTRPALCKQFGFTTPPTQQTLSETWRALDDETQRVIDESAIAIAHVAHENDVISEALLPTSPDEDKRDTDEQATEQDREWKRQKATKTIELARRYAFPVFDSGRADNRTYDDKAILEMVARICTMGESAHGEGEYGWLTDDDTTASGDTILRVLKQFATPGTEEAQLTIDDFAGDDRMPAITEIRDTLMDSFESATDHILGTIRGDDPFDDRHVTAAIDITYERFWPTPWENKDEGIAKSTFPPMVSGYKHDGEVKRGYKYATITLVGDVAPIILAVEPVKENSVWEDEGAASYAKGELVARLLDQAQQYVDIDQVMFDRGFHSHDVYIAVDERDLTYLAPVPKYEDDLDAIEDIKSTEGVDAGVIHDVPFESDGGHRHTAEYIYAPVDTDGADGNYGAYVTNRDHVAPEEIDSVVNEYNRRRDIENQYKSIEEFLPRTSSTDYRVRLCNFVLASLLYNLWRLTDYLIKVGIGEPIRSPPVISANTFVRALGDFLRRYA